ncbi:MAG: ATP-dependent helicase [Anaerolineae bacterium]|nr:MAG: ATP-dependent helicase [Anaerolineae bacterium]WKZ44528.1 MAG: DEAD/DEAH box helicase [Anaerolineales bacterium]
MPLDALLDFWKRDADTAPNLVAWRTLPPRPARTLPFPDGLPAPLSQALIASGIHSLYAHQLEAWTATQGNRNIILSTGTASGKTLAYNLPVFAKLLQDENARALYLFPTKALTQDQFSNLQSLVSGLQSQFSNYQLPITQSPTPAIYDGDTPSSSRAAIRKTARLLLTNPDMLHTGILPHHTNWLEFFSNLKYVVIDEAHTYRGVFGSHVANVIRRLKRVANFYGAKPQFILASATIGNPQELAEKLIEEPVTLIDDDGSARGPRHFIIYNPPLVDQSLGLRKSSLLESVRLARELVNSNIQSVVFARSRRSVEIILSYLQGEMTPDSSIESPLIPYESLPNPRSFVRGYRSGYLPAQRREIEKGLRDGSVKTVVATNALELGIDIGGLGAAILVGYPGSVASARQQAGRAGRGLESAVSVMVASANPIDQFLAHHPEYFFERSPEQALVNPDHLLILLEHLRCAMFELPFKKGEGFGAISAETIEEYLNFLVENREAHFSNEKYFWMADQYPAANISLRSASPQSVVLQIMLDDRPQTIGIVDGESAAWMAHPGAIYLHEAQQYFVEKLDLEERVARLRPVASDYYTEPLQQTEVELLSESAHDVVCGGDKRWGELQITNYTKGFRKRRWYTHETLGEEPLDLPPSELQTTGYWLSLSEETVASLREAGAWTNDPNDYGPEWSKIRERVRRRDQFTCQVCGVVESPSSPLRASRQHDVHHKIPFRAFASREEANRLENLTTLCPSCHHKVEQNVRIKSGLAGVSYILGNLAPLFLMCDSGDLGRHIEPMENQTFGQPTVAIYDSVPAGIGFSEKLFELHDELIARAFELVSACPCADGCPSCVGPGGENGGGGKQESLALLKRLVVGT